MISPVIHSFLLHQVLRFFRYLIPFWLIVIVLVRAASGQTLHWDLNGPEPGRGGPSPSGVWSLSAANWGDAEGDGPGTTWTNSGLETAAFAGATGSYEVALAAGEAIRLAGLSVEEGQVRILSSLNGLDFGVLTVAVSVADGAALTLDAAIHGAAGLTKSGAGYAALRVGGPTGSYVVTGGVLEVGQGVVIHAGALTLGGSAGLGATLALASDAVFNIEGNVTFSGVGTPLAAGITGGTLALNGNRSIVVQNIAAAVDLTVDSIIADGVTSSGITKGGGGTLLLTGTNSYTGSTVIPAGTGIVRIEGNQAGIASSSVVTVGAAAVLSLGAAADSVAVDRLGNDSSITLTGGIQGGATLNYTGSDFAAQTTHTEQVGELLIGGNHRSFITLTPGNGDTQVLSATSLKRAENGVLLLRGANLGAAAGTPNSTRLLLSEVPQRIGSTGIVPWIIGDTSVTGNGGGFVTYDAAVGIRLLNAGEYAAPQAAGTGANVLKSTAGNITLAANLEANSWTNASTGTTTLGTRTLRIESGAMLFTANGTLTGGALDLTSANQGIVHLAGSVAVTATINSPITGQRGLIVSGTGTGNKTLVLGSNNTFTGGVSIYTGILQLNAAGALNLAGSNAVTIQTGGTLRLNGNSVTIAELAGSGNVLNNHATNAAVLTLGNGGAFNGTLNDGAAASLGLTKGGEAALILGANNGYTGATVIKQGTLHVNGTGANPGTAGRLSGTQSISVGTGSVLQINNGNANNTLSDRINDAAAITLTGASLVFNHSGVAGVGYAETLGAVVLSGGGNTITTSQANANGGSSTLTLSGLSRDAGATLNFTGTGLGVTGRNRVEIIGLAEGFVGGWATVGAEFAKYVGDVDAGTIGNQSSLAAFTAADYTTTAANDATAPWTATVHAKPAVDQGTAQGLTTSKQVASLNLGSGIDVILGAAAILNVDSGGLVKQGGTAGSASAAGRSVIRGGKLTAGGGQSVAELFVRVTGAHLTIESIIADNPGDCTTAGSVSLVKSGAGTLVLRGTNTYTGKTYINDGGVLQVGLGGDGGSLAQAGASGSTGAGDTLLNLGAELTGSGLVQGTLTLSGGELRPGDTLATAGDRLGTLWIGGGVLFDGGVISLQVSQATLNLAALADPESSGYASAVDSLLTNPALGGTISTFQHDHLQLAGVFDWAGGDGKVSVVHLGYAPVAGDVFKLLDWTGVLNADQHDVGGRFRTGVEAGYDLELPLLPDGLNWDTSLWANHGILIVAIPEPSRMLLLGLGMATALGVRRRRLLPHSANS